MEGIFTNFLCLLSKAFCITYLHLRHAIRPKCLRSDEACREMIQHWGECSQRIIPLSSAAEHCLLNFDHLVLSVS